MYTCNTNCKYSLYIWKLGTSMDIVIYHNYNYILASSLNVYIPKLASTQLIKNKFADYFIFKGTWSHEDFDILQFYKV